MTLIDKFTGAKAEIVAAGQGLKQLHDKLLEEITANERECDTIRTARFPDAEFIGTGLAVVDTAAAGWAREEGRAFLLALIGEDLTGVATTPPAPRMPWALDDGLPWGAQCFLFREQTKKAVRDGITALLAQGILGPAGLPRAQRAARLADLERELQALQRAEEEAVDQLQAAGFGVPHRPDVRARREREKLAAERAAEDQAYRDRVAQGRRDGTLGTPVVRQAGPRAVPSPYMERR